MKMMQWTAVMCLTGWAALAAAQAPLTPGQIDRWVGAMEDLDAWAEEAGLEREDFATEDDEKPDFSIVLDRLGEHRAGFERVLSEHGFDDASAWADVSNRITAAYMTMMWEDGAEERAAARSEMQDGMQEQLRRIEEDPDLSDEQKTQLIEQIEEITRMYESDDASDILGVEASDDDIAAVRERTELLDQLFSGMGDERGQE